MKSLGFFGVLAVIYVVMIKAAQFMIATFCTLLFGTGIVLLVRDLLARVRPSARQQSRTA